MKLEKFCSTDTNYPDLHRVFLYSGHACASDGTQWAARAAKGSSGQSNRIGRVLDGIPPRATLGMVDTHVSRDNHKTLLALSRINGGDARVQLCPATNQLRISTSDTTELAGRAPGLAMNGLECADWHCALGLWLRALDWMRPYAWVQAYGSGKPLEPIVLASIDTDSWRTAERYIVTMPVRV